MASPDSHALRGDLHSAVARALDAVSIVDVHTHLFDPAMGELLLTGIDELLTYHYHVAELMRARPDLAPAEFLSLPKSEQADLVWRELFVERTPLSEVGRGIVELFTAMGVDPGATDLSEARAAWPDQGDTPALVDRVMRMAGVREVCMTDDPLDPHERSAWELGFERDPRFVAALRLDSAIMDWPKPVPLLRAIGCDVEEGITERTVTALRRYLVDWHARMDARYMAVSLPPELGYFGAERLDEAPVWMQLLVRAVIPAAAERGTPVALMIGVKRGVNPRLALAGDGVGNADVDALERLVADHPDTRFLVTLLSREGQHQFAVAARKFANITPFGAWWFMNNEPLFQELTAMRLDLLGPTFVPQHSDCRVLEQLYFKWKRSRAWLVEPFAHRYADLERAGLTVTEEMIARDLEAMLGRGF